LELWDFRGFWPSLGIRLSGFSKTAKNQNLGRLGQFSKTLFGGLGKPHFGLGAFLPNFPRVFRNPEIYGTWEGIRYSNSYSPRGGTKGLDPLIPQRGFRNPKARGVPTQFLIWPERIGKLNLNWKLGL